MNRLLCIVALSLLAGCGDSQPEASDPDTGADTSTSAPSTTPAPEPQAAPEETCDEVTDLQVAFSDKEKLPVPGFTLTHTTGFIAGMSYNGKSAAKLAYLILANYEPKLTRLNLEPPTEAGQVAILLTFKTENKVVSLKQQNEAYAKMRVPEITYQPGWMKKEASYQVAYYVGGTTGGPAISDDATGEATLTHSTAHLVCGRIDFKSPAGTTIKGTFHVKIEKDMWAR